MAGWMSRSWPALMTRLAINFKLPLRTNNELDCLGDGLVDFIISPTKKQNKMFKKCKWNERLPRIPTVDSKLNVKLKNLDTTFKFISLFPHRQKTKKIRKTTEKKLKRMVKQNFLYAAHATTQSGCFSDKFVLDETTEKTNIFDTWNCVTSPTERERKNRNATTQFPRAWL
jgi:hypothetical protein